MSDQVVITSDNIRISYEDHGDHSGPAIILIMGLGAQMTVWPDDLIKGLVNKGFRVIRFDNRDVGLSSHLDHFGSPNLLTTWLRARLRRPQSIPYQLDDMAGDVIELMDALKIKRTHLVGVSMGGMIAQILAAKHRKRVLSLTSIMSTTAASTLSRSSLSVMLKLARRPQSTNKDAIIDYNMRLNRLIGGTKYSMDESTLYRHAVNNTTRGYNPAGVKRQLAAITASTERHDLARSIRVPTLVIHGTEDPIVPIHGGKASAEVIRKAKFKAVRGMGHNLPDTIATKLTKWISKHIFKAEKKRSLKKKRRRLANLSC